MDSVNVRNLEQIQEDDSARGPSRLAALLLAAIGGGALVVTGMMTMKRAESPARPKADPLTALVEQAKARPPAPAAETVARQSVTFPAILSDSEIGRAHV